MVFFPVIDHTNTAVSYVAFFSILKRHFIKFFSKHKVYSETFDGDWMDNYKISISIISLKM